jgi:hypothetical protein
MSEDPNKALLEHVERIVRDMEARLVKKLDENMEAADALAARKQGAAERQRRFRERHGDGGWEHREEIFARDGYKCLACGATERLSLDHIVPRVKGGDNDFSNLQTLCIPCNSKKNSGDFRVTSVTQPNVTRGSLKALDLSTQDQDLDQRSQRHVTPKTSPTHAVWQAYSEAYERRYGTKPVRNASVNGKLARVVGRLGEEAAEVAAFYLSHPAAFYATRGHPVGLLLLDAEKLRTEWATARPITGTEARQQEKTAANMGGWERMLKREPDAMG